MKRMIKGMMLGWLFLALVSHESYAQNVYFAEKPIDLNVPGISCIKVFDLDRDGDDDVVGATEIPGIGMYWWRNEGGNPIQWTRFVVDIEIDDAMSVEVAYIDNDTFPDIIATELYQGQIDWWRNGGDPTLGWGKHVVGASYGAHDAMCADVNADGHTDIIGVSSYPGSISIFYNDGNASPGWIERSLDSLSGAKTITTHDIDRDGDLDIIGAAETADMICWWENLGGNPVNWSRHVISNDFDGAQIAMPVLMNDDSLYDIIAAGAECDQIAYWICQDLAANQWVKHIVTDQLGLAVNARCGDLDGDGDLDIAAVGMIPGELTVFWNDDFTWVPMVLRSDFGRGWALEIDDIDYDGDLDIISGAEDIGGLFLWKNIPDFRPHLVPDTITIMPGETTDVMVSIDSHNDYHGTVNLSACLYPDPGQGQVSFTFNPMHINPSGACSLTVAASSDIAPGKYPVTVTVADSMDTLNLGSVLSLWILGSGQAAVVGGDHSMMELVRGIWEPVDSLWSVPPVIGENYQAMIIEHCATVRDTALIRQYIAAGGRVLLTRQTPFDLCGTNDISSISSWVGASGYSLYGGSGIPIVSTYDQPFGVSGIQTNDTIGMAASGFGRLSGLGANGVRLARLGTVNTVLAGVYCGSGSGHCLYYTGGGGISPQSDSLIRGFLINPALGVENQDTHVAFANGKEISLKVYPNPATTGTTVSFVLTKPVWVNLEVYDILGRRIRKIASNVMEPGVNTIHWDGKNDKDQNAATGVYFMKLEWCGQSKIARFAVVR